MSSLSCLGYLLAVAVVHNVGIVFALVVIDHLSVKGDDGDTTVWGAVFVDKSLKSGFVQCAHIHGALVLQFVVQCLVETLQLGVDDLLLVFLFSCLLKHNEKHGKKDKQRKHAPI